MSELDIPMRERWDPFLDTYNKVKSERDQALVLLEAWIELFPKTKKEKLRKDLAELKERIENG